MTKKQSKQSDDSQQKIEELTADLQRIRADFENYRKRVDADKANLTELTKAATVIKLLPVIDTIERAIMHTPAELAENPWVQGVTSMAKNLDKSVKEFGLSRIVASAGTAFDPHLHEAVMMQDGEGEQEVIVEELRSGYLLNGNVVRPSMVKVGRL